MKTAAIANTNLDKPRRSSHIIFTFQYLSIHSTDICTSRHTSSNQELAHRIYNLPIYLSISLLLSNIVSLLSIYSFKYRIVSSSFFPFPLLSLDHSIPFFSFSFLTLDHSILSYSIPFYSIPSYFILSHSILSYFILSHSILFYPIPSYPIPFHPILSHLIPSYPILSYLNTNSRNLSLISFYLNSSFLALLRL